MQHAWAEVVAQLRGRGYLESAAPTPCKLAAGGELPDVVLNRLSEAALGVSDLWPLKPGVSDEETFCSLVELVHDHVARPRSRWKHNPGTRAIIKASTTCGWHYRDFATEPGQLLYRWRVDRIFAGYGVELRLSASAENCGRLVRLGPADRAELMEQALNSPTASDVTAHAIALWRRRDVTASDKRSAVVALAGVLEGHRRVLKKELFRRTRRRCFRSPTSSPCGITPRSSVLATTKLSWTGSSGGISPRSSSPIDCYSVD